MKTFYHLFQCQQALSTQSWALNTVFLADLGWALHLKCFAVLQNAEIPALHEIKVTFPT